MSSAQPGELPSVPEEIADAGRFYATVRWLDRQGRPRLVDVFAEHRPQARVWAYARADPPALVGVLRADDKFLRLEHGRAAAYGLDTTAAWNNLIEVCRAAHTAH